MNPTAVSYRLTPAAGRFRWLRNCTEVASAAWREHSWDVYEGDRVVLSMFSGSGGGHTRVALLDHVTRTTATFGASEPMTRSHIGEVYDSAGAVRMAVRADGPTGLHVIDPSGELLALTSRRRPPDGHGCDVLVTALGAAYGATLAYGLPLTLELLRAGGLRRAA